MRILLTSTILLLWLFSTGWAADSGGLPQVDPNNPGSLQEAIRLLTEEVKLAARPRTYVVIDLVSNAVLIKGRGIEFHRIPIEHWSVSHLTEADTTFRLQERPPITRRKIDPARERELPPISLDDMPTAFTLQFSPHLTIVVQPSARKDPWHWLLFKGHEWWTWLTAWSITIVTGHSPPPAPVLHLTVTSDDARSLAWTVTEGMPFLVRRTPSSIP